MYDAALRNVFKKLFWSYYILYSIYYLKLDISAMFIKKSPVWLVVRGAVLYYRKCHILSLLLLFRNVVFLEITYQHKTRACQKNKSHVVYHIPWNLPRNCCNSANNKGKFRIVGLREMLVNFKASQVKEKLTSLRVFRGNTCFGSKLPFGKFIWQYWLNVLKCCVGPRKLIGSDHFEFEYEFEIELEIDFEFKLEFEFKFKIENEIKTKFEFELEFKVTVEIVFSFVLKGEFCR